MDASSPARYNSALIHESYCQERLYRELTMSLTAEPTVMSGKTRVLGGITVIDTPLITRALDYARIHSEPFLFNHAVRSWLFAVRLGQLQGVPHDAEVVAVGTLLHDLGLTNSFTGPKRFEIEGADAARAFAREHGLDDRRVQLIWDSVALNSTPSIGLYKEAEVALCTAGIFAGMPENFSAMRRKPAGSRRYKTLTYSFPMLSFQVLVRSS